MPQLLFRGDRDDAATRQLRQTWHSGYVLTNLANGGSGREIFSQPLVELATRHVDVGWAKTHFLSFSANRQVAEGFAKGPSAANKTLVALPPETEPWETSILTFEWGRLQRVASVGAGVLVGEFPDDDRYTTNVPLMAQIARKIEASKKPGVTMVRLLLIDVVTSLSHAASSGVSGLDSALAKARRDEEWLVLPMDPFPGAAGELTATLDDACLLPREKFAVR